MVQPMGESWPSDDRHQVIWDGECLFCGRAMSWFERRDTRGRLSFVAYQAVPSPPMTPEWERACSYALYVQTNSGERLRAGRATLFILDQLGFVWTARILGLPPLVWAVEALYWLMARNRRLFGKFLFRKEAERRWRPPSD